MSTLLPVYCGLGRSVHTTYRNTIQTTASTQPQHHLPVKTGPQQLPGLKKLVGRQQQAVASHCLLMWPIMKNLAGGQTVSVVVADGGVTNENRKI